MNTEYRTYFSYIREMVLSGQMTYDDAKVATKDKLDELNKKGSEIAKKHGKKFYPFSLAGLLR